MFVMIFLLGVVVGDFDLDGDLGESIFLISPKIAKDMSP
jgi:hypothetical protein